MTKLSPTVPFETDAELKHQQRRVINTNNEGNQYSTNVNLKSHLFKEIWKQML